MTVVVSLERRAVVCAAVAGAAPSTLTTAPMRVADRVAEVRSRNRLWRAQRRGQDDEEVHAVDDGETTEDREQQQLAEAEEILPVGQHDEYFAS